MWSNNFKIALRSLGKNSLFTFLNILGLTIGMATTLLLLLWVQNEWTFDTYHKDADRIHRIICHWTGTGEMINIESIPIRLKVEAEVRIPEIEKVHLLRPANQNPLVRTTEGNVFEENEMAYIDENWFGAFQYEILEGSVEDFNADRHSLALTQDQAEKYFGEKPLIGQSLEIGDQLYTLRLILDKNPSNSSFQFKTYVPLASFWADEAAYQEDFESGNFNYVAFFKASKNFDQEKVSKQLADILNEDEEEEEDLSECSLIPLSAMRFNQGLPNDFFQHQNKSTVTIFALIGFILLLAAALNYINLTTALISKRVKEIGIKKVVGANFRSIFTQFMIEAFVVILASFVFALAIMNAVLPFLNQYIGANLILDFTNIYLWYILLGTLLLSLVSAGIYPAIMSGSFKPLQLIRGKYNAQKGLTLRKVLVVLQFTSVIAILISTLVIYQQLQYIGSKDVGYDRTNVIRITPNLFRVGDWGQNFEKFFLFKEELAKLPEIEAAALTDVSLINIQNRNSGGFRWEGQAEGGSVNVSQMRANEDMKAVFDLEMKEGRWFKEELATDQNNFIINEKAIKTFGIEAPFIGKKVAFQGREGQIIGVVKDFIFSNLRNEIEPLVIWHSQNRGNTILARIEGNDKAAAIEKVKAKFNEILPGILFKYNFVEEGFEKMHESDAKLGFLFRLFAGLLIFISCLGLFGLSVFTAEQRIKEIGVRKVLGASVRAIIGLLSKDFLKLVLIALILASPVAWFAMDNWLENFAFRIQIQWWIFLLTGILAIMVAFITISYQSAKAALGNPVKSLRQE